MVGKDEDGEAITSLAARHINCAAELVAAHKDEANAGRSGRMAQLLEMAWPGMTEKELRLAFYGALLDLDMEAKKKAYYRARDAAMAAGFIEFGSEQGSLVRRLIVLKEWK